MAQRTSVQYVRYYTEGTAARKLEFAVPVKKKPAVLPKPKKVKVKKVYVDPVAVLGVVVALCMLIVMAAGVGQLKQAREEARTMELYVSQLTREQESLTAQYADTYDLNMIKQTALALGMVPSQEVPQTQIEVILPEVEEEPTTWENIGTFLTNLFA